MKFIHCLLVATSFFASATFSYTASEQAYVCPMHPQIMGEKGDACPICGMTLVRKAKS